MQTLDPAVAPPTAATAAPVTQPRDDAGRFLGPGRGAEQRPDAATVDVIAASFEDDPAKATRATYVRLLATAESIRAELAAVVGSHGATSRSGRVRSHVELLLRWQQEVRSLLDAIASLPTPYVDPVAALRRAEAAAKGQP